MFDALLHVVTLIACFVALLVTITDFATIRYLATTSRKVALFILLSVLVLFFTVAGLHAIDEIHTLTRSL